MILHLFISIVSMFNQLKSIVMYGAVIHPFPTLTQKPVHTPLIGDGFKLSCEPPYNYPTGGGNIYWSLITPDNTEDIFRNVQISERIALDYSGNKFYQLQCLPLEDLIIQSDTTICYLSMQKKVLLL